MNLTGTQKRYTTTGKDLLSIVNTLMGFCAILPGDTIVVYTDRNDIYHKSTEYYYDRVLCQILTIKYCCAELKYIKRENIGSQ